MQGKYRHELKYRISYLDYLALRPRLKAVMHSDPHTNEQGLYYIHSIYFDNFNDKALREKIDGVQKREKYRIRWYNDSKEILTLEKKMKINDLCMKFGVRISNEQFTQILDGMYDFLRDSRNEIMQEFYYRIISEKLRPVVQVSYTREPYIYEYGNVRITFDSSVQTSFGLHDHKLSSAKVGTEDDPNGMILEVKFDEYLPSVIQCILQTGNFRQTAFSKYGSCRRYF